MVDAVEHIILQFALTGLGCCLMALVAVFVVRQLRDAMKTLHRSCGTVGCALFVIFAIATSVVAQKGTNAPAANPPRMMTGLRPAVSPIEVDATNFPTNFPTVTNLCFWYIYKFADSVDLGLAWPNGTTFENNLLDVFLNYELSSNHWDKVASVDVSAASSNLIVNLDAALLATNGASAFFRAATQTDADGDGLSDAEERWTYHTDPANPDSDGDNLCDGWEIKYGLDPSVANVANLIASADTDHDGLSNHYESLLDTNPFDSDTDGDGIADGVEVPTNWLSTAESFLKVAIGTISEPSAPLLMARPPVPTVFDLSYFNANFTNPNDADNNGYAALGICWGDPSTSHSEKYRISITSEDGGSRPSPAVNAEFGICDLCPVYLRRGHRYGLRLEHVKTRPDHEVDPDYALYLATFGDPISIVDSDGLLGACSVTNGVFTGSGKCVDIAVHKAEICFCNPEDWTELPESRVILDDEVLRLKITITPAMGSLQECVRKFGNAVHVCTSGTNPDGVDVDFDANTSFSNVDDHSEIKIEKSRSQLIDLGLLPQNDEDGINEMASIDMGSSIPSADSNLSDSQAFLGLGHELRGNAHENNDGGLEQSPPVSAPSESFFKAAGAEIVSATYGDAVASKRQVMNQADYFYYSGHGNISTGGLQGQFSPSMVENRWVHDVNVGIIFACSVLNIGKYRYQSFTVGTKLRWIWRTLSIDGESPGEKWERSGAKVLLGYCWRAPVDKHGATLIVAQFREGLKLGLSAIDAWRDANNRPEGRNAVAIDCSVDSHVYWYWDESSGSPIWTNVVKGVETW